MKIKYINQDITEEDSGVIVQGVNCQGVQGSGVALAIRKKWPKVYSEYKQFCDTTPSKEMLLGHNNIVHINSDLLIVNAFTQLSYGRDGKEYASYDAIRSCMNKLMKTLDTMKSLDIDTDNIVKMPMLGCGLGGLNWVGVSRIIREELHAIDTVNVYFL